MCEIEQLDLSTLKEGDSFQVVAGVEPNAFEYNLCVIKPSKEPLCELTQIDPQGKIVGPHPIICKGTGHWTTPDQNPTQRGDPLMGKPHQELALTINYGRISVGDFLIAYTPESFPPRILQFEPECTKIITQE